jgi:histidinol-phosphate phosphatase family protein
VKQAVILAGGKGTRLAERLNGLPKPLIDVCGLPLLERQILLLQRYGFTHVLVLVNFAAQQIVDFCAARNNWGLDLQCIDDGSPRGTAGATLKIMNRLAEEFLVMYGDTMLEVDLNRFYGEHISRPKASATLFLHPNDHPQDSDLVELDDAGWVVAFHPYPHAPGSYFPNLVNAALYWVRKSALTPFEHREGLLDFGKNLFPEMLAKGQLLAGYNSIEYIKDCGTPGRLDKVCNDFRSGRIDRASLSHSQIAVFLDRDGTINHEVGHLARAEQIELLPGVAQAIIRLNRSDYRSVVVTNQPVLARGDCTAAEMRRINARLETLLGEEGAYLDRIYLCPHHPDAGFAGEVPELKIECTCRKPKTGMVEAAALDLNIARSGSWMVGDTLVDVAMARAAGLRSVLVETGYAGLDYRAPGLPDFTVPDLVAAVDFILDVYPVLLQRADEQSADVGIGDLLLVGGLARSGKSNFASVLEASLRARGLSVVKLSLDRWLLDEAQRGAGVLERYDLASVVRFLSDRKDGKVRVDLKGYHKILRERLSTGEQAVLLPTDVVIVEGTVALALASRFPEAHQIRVEIDEESRRKRVVREYRLRRFSDEASEEIYASRQIDEDPVIRAIGVSANRVSMDFVNA